MKIYLDTSLLIAALVGEDESQRAQAWLRGSPTGSLAISDWSITEFSSAVSIKVRSGTMAADQRADVLASWTALRKTSLTTLAVLPAHFSTAATYAEIAELGLRAGDALHLAVAAANGCAIATLDEAQGRAAVELGVPREEL